MHKNTLSILLILAVAGLCSCSKGPTGPQPGTPAFYWSAAKETWRTGDYLKTSENLQLLAKGTSEFAPQARPWLVVVAAGLTQGYADYADKFEAGARMAKNASGAFHRTANGARSAASNYALVFAESFHNMMDSDKGEKVPLAFAFPMGTLSDPPQLPKIAKGMTLPPAEQDILERTMLQRAVLMMTCRVAGAAGDSAKALAVFQPGNAEATRPVFLFEMAKALNDQSDLFGSKKLDQPARIKILLKEAGEAIAAVPPTKESKALSGKIQEKLKKIKA